MGQPVYHDHPEKRLWRGAKQRGDADFVFTFKFAALGTGDKGVGTQRSFNGILPIIEIHLGESGVFFR